MAASTAVSASCRSPFPPARRFLPEALTWCDFAGPSFSPPSSVHEYGVRRLSGNALVMRRGDALFVGGDEDLDVLAVVAVILGYIVSCVHACVCMLVYVREVEGWHIQPLYFLFKSQFEKYSWPCLKPQSSASARSSPGGSDARRTHAVPRPPAQPPAGGRAWGNATFFGKYNPHLGSPWLKNLHLRSGQGFRA